MLAQELFIASFRDATNRGTLKGVAYWRGVLDMLESLELYGNAPVFFKRSPFTDHKEKEMWSSGTKEGLRLWRINK